MFEHKTERLLPFPLFVRRIAFSLLMAVGLIVVSLGIGIAGYHFLEGLSWIDSLLNAAMILTGMGQVSPIQTTSAKLFATFYALFSGVLFLVAVSFLLAPIFHRLLHQFHLDDVDENADILTQERDEK